MTQQEKERLFCELNEGMALRRLEYTKRIQELGAQKRELYRRIDEAKVKIAAVMQEHQLSIAEFNRRKAEIINIVPETSEEAETDSSHVHKQLEKMAEKITSKIDEL